MKATVHRKVGTLFWERHKEGRLSLFAPMKTYYELYLQATPRKKKFIGQVAHHPTGWADSANQNPRGWIASYGWRKDLGVYPRLETAKRAVEKYYREKRRT